MQFPIEKLKNFLTASDTPAATVNYQRRLLIILLCWAVFWTVLPCIALANDFVDVLENIVWGRHWQLGYDKNPYLGAWFGYAVREISGRSFFSSFLASQLLVGVGIFSVWQTAKRILPARTAFLAAISLLTVNFYGIKAVELCDDIMEIGLWPLTMLWVYLGVRGEEKNVRSTGCWPDLAPEPLSPSNILLRRCICHWRSRCFLPQRGGSASGDRRRIWHCCLSRFWCFPI